MKLAIPELSLVILIGASGSGKSSFAKKHFKTTEILSSDAFRAMVRDDENDQSASKDAFDVLHYVLKKRLAAGRLTVVDATNVQGKDRRSLLKLAKQYHFYVVAIALNLPEAICQQRNQQRPNRQVPPHVVSTQIRCLTQSLATLDHEKFRHIYTLNTPEEIESVEIDRQRLSNNQKQDSGPFDIIGDVHGCCDELEALLQQLGYQPENMTEEGFWHFPTYRHPKGRKAIFLGDLVDRGPRILNAVKLVHNMVEAGSALCLVGNHENKLMRKLSGKQVKLTFGLAETVAEIEAIPEEVRDHATFELQSFLKSLDSHYVFDNGNLVVAHAGLKEDLQGRRSGYVHNFAIYGDTTGETDKFGLPVRYEWATEYKGKAAVVYGHTPVAEATWLNNTIDIDTGCVFGGKLTALRYPEKALVSVNAARVYCRPVKPLSESWADGVPQHQSNVLDISNLLGKRILSTRLYKKITLKEENSAAALEVLSRFSVSPKWLIYLPPTIPPVEASKQPGLLEHPAEAFEYYRQQGVGTVVCEEKHMGTRVVVIVCRDESVAQRRFGLADEGIGVCYTRTGRRFFDNAALESAFLSRLRNSLDLTAFWEKFSTDWVCLDCELMPWSAKAQGLLKNQYAPVGAAATNGLKAAVAHLKKASDNAEATALLSRYQQKEALAQRYVQAYQRQCWPVETLLDLTLAPFHILATEGCVHSDKTHEWHLQQISTLVQFAPELMAKTRYMVVNLSDDESCVRGDRWWQSIISSGSEGMVIKPMDFIHRGHKGLAQPALKCRGVEVLRMVYGPEYSLPKNLMRLKKRGTGKKRAIALREFSLGIEALEQFVAKASVSKVHECILGVLALESESVDLRL